MKKVIALLLGLTAASASFAQNTTDDQQDVFIRSTNQKVEVYVAPQTADATIKLLDGEGHTLFLKTSTVINGFRQKLDLSELEPGSYHLTVLKAGEKVEKTIVIETLPAQKQISLKA
ncbi:hypothetical protein WBJ53_09800 [Spirosoma sp. SC4-14]|uniref:hypothetical protein n=1 Tax=Spirosoma sp. SC4-14 TaxID=3128900 RepID=UPI0030D13D01